MCEMQGERGSARSGAKAIPVAEAVGMVLAHDITEVRKDDFKGRAFRKGHVVTSEDIEHLQRLGKDHLFVLHIAEDEMHEDDAAYALASALKGESVVMEGEPKEGKINLVAARDGLLKIDRDTLAAFNMLGEVMCASLHTNTVVKKGQVVAGTRAIPLVVKRAVVDEAVGIAGRAGAVIEVKEMRKAKAGVVITGNEVYYGRIKDAFAPIVTRKIEGYGGEIVGIYYAPDDESLIEARLRELLEAGADLLITTGGMSVDPDDVTRFAIRNLGASEITYGSAVLPGAMFLAAYLDSRQQPGNGSAHASDGSVPLLGIPACGMYHKTTIFDLVLPRVLAGEKIGRKELAELGHGGLCLDCKECRYPVCPFGK
ncbi:MAG: molybdopterin-binding protein [Thermodesulfovibrionales bacterium]